MAANDAPETVTDALVLLAREGYEADFNIRHAAIACPGCAHENEVPTLRAGSTLETCAGCKRESGVLWIGTWDGPLGAFDV